MIKYQPRIGRPLLLAIICLLSLSCGAPKSEGPALPREPAPRAAAVPGRLVGCIATTCSEDMAIYGDYVYVADGPAGLRVINCTDPVRPILAKTVPTTYAIRVFRYSTYLYLCDGPAGLKVFSIQNPLDPLLTQTTDTEWACSATFGNGYLYLADYYHGVMIFYMADPAHPALAVTKSIGRARDVIVNGATLAISDAPFGLTTFFFNGILEPIWTYSDCTRLGNFEDLVGHDGYAIIARSDEASSIAVFDISDPFYVQFVRELYPARYIDGLTASGDVLLAACGEEGVKGFDLSDPARLDLLWTMPVSGYARRAKASGRFIYVAEMSSLSIYDREGLGGSW